MTRHGMALIEEYIAGTEATVVRYDGLVHDFMATAPLFECSRQGLENTVRAIKQHLN